MPSCSVATRSNTPLALLLVVLTLPLISTEKYTMADVDDKEKAEKLAAAKKRVRSPHYHKTTGSIIS